MNRQALISRLHGYEQLSEIAHAIEILASSRGEDLSNSEIGDVWERVSKAIDIKFSDDEEHDAWTLEAELSAAYQCES